MNESPTGNKKNVQNRAADDTDAAQHGTIGSNNVIHSNVRGSIFRFKRTR